VFANFKQDLQRNLADYGAASPLRRFALALTLNSIHALALIRFQLWLARHHLPTLLPAKLLFWFFKIEVSSRATIGPGLRLPHPMGIIIAPNSHIGAHCDLYADVRLVLSHGRPQGPHLEDGVFMGDGAKAVGAIRIGARATIGVSAVVTRDIPPNAVAAGIPARVLVPNSSLTS
jgi:serine O-acetyltransferase